MNYFIKYQLESIEEVDNEWWELGEEYYIFIFI